jgi:hypothetical protein
MAVTETYFNDRTADIHTLISGQFSTTVRVSYPDATQEPYGIAWDGTNTSIGRYLTNYKIELLSGKLTSTVKDSITSISGAGAQVLGGFDWDENMNLNGANVNSLKLEIFSGQFSSTFKDSRLVSSIDANVFGGSVDDTNTPWVGIQADKLYLMSGRLTGTLKTSMILGVYLTDRPSGISWDGTNSPVSDFGNTQKKMKLHSGQFNSTIKTSVSITTIRSGSTDAQDQSHDDTEGRTGLTAGYAGSILKVASVLQASIKKVIGVANASIKKIAGVSNV